MGCLCHVWKLSLIPQKFHMGTYSTDWKRSISSRRAKACAFTKVKTITLWRRRDSRLLYWFPLSRIETESPPKWALFYAFRRVKGLLRTPFQFIETYLEFAAFFTSLNSFAHYRRSSITCCTMTASCLIPDSVSYISSSDFSSALSQAGLKSLKSLGDFRYESSFLGWAHAYTVLTSFKQRF